MSRPQGPAFCAGAIDPSSMPGAVARVRSRTESCCAAPARGGRSPALSVDRSIDCARLDDARSSCSRQRARQGLTGPGPYCCRALFGRPLWSLQSIDSAIPRSPGGVVLGRDVARKRSPARPGTPLRSRAGGRSSRTRANSRSGRVCEGGGGDRTDESAVGEGGEPGFLEAIRQSSKRLIRTDVVSFSSELSIDRERDLSVGQQKIEQSVDRSIDRSVGRSVDRSVGRSVGRSSRRSIDWSINRSTDRSTDRSIDRPID